MQPVSHSPLFPKSFRTRRGLATALIALAALVTLAAPACSSSKDVASVLDGLQRCSLNSDCAKGLLCAIGKCRVMCATSADCSGGSCIDNGAIAVCQPAAEKNTPCDKQSDCPSPLACASDYRCRNLCQTTADCNVLGITGRVCATDANGVQYCADPSEASNGKLTAAPAPGHASGPVMEPSGSMMDGSPGGGNEATTGDSAMGGQDASADAPAVCIPACSQMQKCVGGASGPTCTPCGTTGMVCCDGQTCGASLTCAAGGTCACGNANQMCCGGNSCNSGLSCNEDDAGGPSTCACGEIGTRCCPGVDGGASSCSAGAACAGSKCTCFAQFTSTQGGVSVVLRTDGTVWSNVGGTFAEMNGNSAPLRATSIAASYGPATAIGCAIVSGGVWCFPPAGETLADSTYLGAGLGPTDSTSVPVQVLTPANGGTPLANIIQISGGLGSGDSSRPNFCAAASDGSAWCWGYGANGQLGNGTTGNASFASQVMTNSTTSFANVVEVSVGNDSSCARKADGSVWCWGTNQEGELGVPAGTTPQSYYPIQVPFSGSTAQRTATRLRANADFVFCAIMQDTSVVCWGYNGNGEAGAPSSNATVGPTSVLVAAGGAPLTGVVDLAGGIAGGYGTMCAKSGALAVLCWGGASSTPYPVAYLNAANTAVVGVLAPLASTTSGIAYIDPDGLLTVGGSSISPAPPCTNLLP